MGTSRDSVSSSSKFSDIMESPLFILKKRILLITFFVRYLFVGAEYSVILPTVLLYMESLDASKVFMGFVVAAYPFAAMLSLPFFGYLYDRTKRTKELLIVLNAFQIAGNIIYSLPFSKWFPVAGRFLAGLGDGFITLVVGEVTYIYPQAYRIGILSLLELGRVIGMTIGPALNFFLQEKSFTLGSVTWNSNSLPGVIMAICWVAMEAITIFCTFNLAKEIISRNESAQYYPLPQNSEEEEEDVKLKEGETEKEETGEEVETNVKAGEDKDIFYEMTGINQESIIDQPQSIPHEQPSYWEIVKEIFSIEFFVICTVDLVLWTSQTIFEILLPYVTEFEFKWSPPYTGLVYMIGGVLLLAIFIGIYLLGEKCGNKDVELLLLSLIFTQIALALLMYETIQKNYWTRVALFSTVCVLVFATIPFNLVCSKSLLTKIMRKELQGTAQGISSAITRIAMIVGPLLSGVIFTRRKDYGAVASVFCYATLICLFCSIKKINRREEIILENEMETYHKQ